LWDAYRKHFGKDGDPILIWQADTAQQGAAVFEKLRSALMDNDSVTVLFEGLDIATSSFVVAAFLPLLEHHRYRDLKRRLRVINSTRQINQMIKSRMERQAANAA
jgi:hypothetical protein